MNDVYWGPKYGHIKVVHTVWWIDAKQWDKYCKDDETEWEKYYSKKETENIGEAALQVMTMWVRNDIIHVKWLTTIYEDGEEIADSWAEIPSTTNYYLTHTVSSELAKKVDCLQKELDEQNKAIKDFAMFLSDMNASEVYKRWKRERSDS